MILLLAAIGAVTVGAPAAGDTLDDAKIVNYAAYPFDKRAKSGKSDVLGVFHGAKVVVDFPCGEVCPEQTVRIIRFDIDPGGDCDRVGGESINVDYPSAAGPLTTRICVPEIMAMSEAAP